MKKNKIKPAPTNTLNLQEFNSRVDQFREDGIITIRPGHLHGSSMHFQPKPKKLANYKNMEEKKDKCCCWPFGRR